MLIVVNHRGQICLDTKYRMFGQAVSKIYGCFALCNVKKSYYFRPSTKMQAVVNEVNQSIVH
jgi:hypothetical protein